MNSTKTEALYGDFCALKKNSIVIERKREKERADKNIYIYMRQRSHRS